MDALVWVFYPVFLYQKGLPLTQVAGVISLYGLVWGGSQLFTGRLSDHIGRQLPNVAGMWLCGAGVAAMVLGEGLVWWSASAVLTGFGMALLYPNLSAAVADIAHPHARLRVAPGPPHTRSHRRGEGRRHAQGVGAAQESRAVPLLALGQVPHLVRGAWGARRRQGARCASRRPHLTPHAHPPRPRC